MDDSGMSLGDILQKALDRAKKERREADIVLAIKHQSRAAHHAEMAMYYMGLFDE